MKTHLCLVLNETSFNFSQIQNMFNYLPVDNTLQYFCLIFKILVFIKNDPPRSKLFLVPRNHLRDNRIVIT